MIKQYIVVLLIIVLLLSGCNQSAESRFEESAPQSLLSATPTVTPAATLPSTLTPVSTIAQVQLTPTAIYSPIGLSAADEIAYQKALNDIPLYRQGDFQIILQDQAGKPLSGYLVRYTQTSHDFLFGGVADPFYVGLLKRAGINTMTVYLALDWLQPDDGVYTLDFANYWLGIDELKNGNFSVKTVDLYPVVADVPPYYQDLSYEEFLQRVYEYESKVVRRFGPSIDYWEAINEPNFGNHNPLNLTKDEYYQAIATSVQAIRDNDPDATVEINLSYPCGGIDWLDNFQIVQEMLDRNIDFDVLGLQFYYNAYIWAGDYQMTRMSFNEMSACFDRYEAMLTPYGKEIVGSEFSVPSGSPSSQTGYWGVPWSEDTQALYLSTAYTIFFSKPSNNGLIWWNTVDPSSFVYYGGLVNEDGFPKKSYFALRRLIDGWTTSGEGLTNTDGSLSISGYGGDYDLEIINPVTGEKMVTQAHIIEQETKIETIEFTGNNLLKEKIANLERLIAYWESNSDQISVQKGKDYLALVNHHLTQSEWDLADQSASAALDELGIITEIMIPITQLIPAGYHGEGYTFENGSMLIWGSTTLHYPYSFPPGTVSVEITAHAQNEKGESPLMVSGIGMNYSPVWMVDSEIKKVYSFEVDTTGDERDFTIRFPYDGRIYERISAQKGEVGELKLYIDQVKFIIKMTEVP